MTLLNLIFIIVGSGIGGFIGGCIGWFYNRKKRREKECMNNCI